MRSHGGRGRHGIICLSSLAVDACLGCGWKPETSRGACAHRTGVVLAAAATRAHGALVRAVTARLLGCEDDDCACGFLGTAARNVFWADVRESAMLRAAGRVIGGLVAVRGCCEQRGSAKGINSRCTVS